MADVYEKNLDSKTSLTVNDYIRVVGSDNVSYKQLVSDVADKIITTYTGASLAGSNQSVKSAIDASQPKTMSQTIAGQTTVEGCLSTLNSKLYSDEHSFTPTSGSSYSGYGGCYYEKIAGIVHVHVGIGGLTQNTNTQIFTLPNGYRPLTTVYAVGGGSNSGTLSFLDVSQSGSVQIRTADGQYARADIMYVADY